MLLFNDKECSIIGFSLYFNTSNVTIQQLDYAASRNQRNFNTSNVTIQLGKAIMLPTFQNNFNTSNVTIQPTILSHLFYSQFHYTHYISTFS